MITFYIILFYIIFNNYTNFLYNIFKIIEYLLTSNSLEIKFQLYYFAVGVALSIISLIRLS